MMGLRQTVGWAFALALVTSSTGVSSAQDAVVDDAGIPLKLITTRETKLYAEPDRSSRSAPTRIFQYWYVLPPDKTARSRRLRDLPSLTRNGFFRVAAGDAEKDFQGWLAAEDVIRWSHRQALRPAPRLGREPVTFYPTREAAADAVSTGSTTAATHREPADSADRLILMPILEAHEASIDGESNQIFKVAFVSAVPGSANGPGHGRPGPSREELLAKVTMDVVFVIDTTASMANPIEQVRSSIARVARNLSNRPDLQKRLRLGLVAYRDSINGRDPGDMEYLSRVFCDLRQGANHQDFLRRLADVEVAKAPSLDYPEDVLAGITLAMNRDRLGWNPYAWKQIVVVGDSSAKEPGHPDVKSRWNAESRTIEAVMKSAQSNGSSTDSIVISVVRVKDPLFVDDHVVGDRQFNTLIAGRTYNGKLISARGGAMPEDFSSELTSSLLGGLGNFESVVLGSQSSPETNGGRSLTAADFPYPVVDMIRSLPDEPAESRFAVRYCTELDADGNRALIPHLFIRKGRLMTFVAFLDFLMGMLEDAGDPGSRDLESILAQLQIMSVTLQIDEPVSAHLQLGKVLGGFLGLPVKTDVFRITIGDLVAMSAGRYQEWLRSVDVSKQTLRFLIDNSNLWFKLHPNVGERDEHAFIALSDLP